MWMLTELTDGEFIARGIVEDEEVELAVAEILRLFSLAESEPFVDRDERSITIVQQEGEFRLDRFDGVGLQHCDMPDEDEWRVL